MHLVAQDVVDLVALVWSDVVRLIAEVVIITDNHVYGYRRLHSFIQQWVPDSVLIPYGS